MSQSPVKVRLISERYSHHASRSGYAQIEKYLGEYVNVSSVGETFASEKLTRWPLSLRENLARRSYTRTYGVQHLPLEASVIQLWLAYSGCVYHFLYGENSFRFTGNLKRLPGLGSRNALVATYHLPSTYLEKILMARDHIGRLDKIIVVGSSQLPFFVDIAGTDKVAHIPHGIDVDYYTPAAERAAPGPIITCLCVGHLFRDFETLLAAAWILKLEKVPVKIVIVDAQFDMPHFSGLDNVEIKCGVPDDELRRVYQDADIFLLPLKDCTANNALLEAMASGLPIVITEVGSVLDYIDSTCALLTPCADPRALVDQVKRLATTPSLRTVMGQAARQRAKRFAWPVVARQVADVYQDLTRRLTA